jgi:hypothetical protein
MRGKGDQLSERLLDFVVKVIKVVDALPTTIAGRHIGGQLVSSGTSCGDVVQITKKVAVQNRDRILSTK